MDGHALVVGASLGDAEARPRSPGQELRERNAWLEQAQETMALRLRRCQAERGRLQAEVKDARQECSYVKGENKELEAMLLQFEAEYNSSTAKLLAERDALLARVSGLEQALLAKQDNDVLRDRIKELEDKLLDRSDRSVASTV
jgi:hypothetical protein